MPDEKKTEEQLRHEIRREFGFSEERDTEKIDRVLELKKDSYKNRQKRKEIEDKLKTGKPDGANSEGSKPEGGQTLSVKDSAVLIENHIPTDDWDDVVEYVQYKRRTEPNYSYKNAIKSSVLKNTLAEKAQERKSSQAIQAGSKKRGSTSDKGDKLLQRAESKGEVPDTDEGMDALVEARLQRKMNANKR